MIVVVETNFIVELILQQDDAASCEELLALCSKSPAHMVAPAFAIAEAGMVLEERRRERQNFVRTDLARHSREIRRAKAFGRMDAILRDLDNELLAAESDAASAWLSFRASLDRIELIPLTADILDETIAIQVGREIDRLPDAIIFASVKKYLAEIRSAGNVEPACFISRDEGAFGKAVILRQLRELDCTFIKSFANGAARVRADRSGV